MRMSVNVIYLQIKIKPNAVNIEKFTDLFQRNGGNANGVRYLPFVLPLNCKDMCFKKQSAKMFDRN